MSTHARRRSLLVAISSCLAFGLWAANGHAAQADPGGTRPGLILEMVFEAGSWQLSRVAEIPQFVSHPPLPPRDPWEARVLGSRGTVLWRGAVAAPPAVEPDGMPWLFTVPQLARAARVELVSPGGQMVTLGDVGRQVREPSLRILADEALEDISSRERTQDSDAKTSDEPTWTISGTVQGPDGEPLQRAGIALIPVGTHSVGGKRTTATDADGVFQLSVPALVHPNRYVLQVGRDSLLRHTELLDLIGDTTVDVQLTAPVALRGAVRNSAGQAVTGVLVRAFAGERFVLSSRTRAGGVYELLLAPGGYRLEVIPSPEMSAAPLLDAEVTLAEGTTLDLVLPEGHATPVRVQFPSAEAMAAAGPIRLEIRRAGRLVRTVSPRVGRTSDERADEPSADFHEITPFLTDGLYTIAAYVVGFDPVELADIQVPVAEPVTLLLGEPHLWSGVLWSADGMPLAQRRMRSYSDTTTTAVSVQTDAGGAFTLPLTPGGLVMVEADDDTLPLWYRVPTETASTSAPLILDSPAPASGGVEPLVQIHGDPNNLAGRINLVIVGDGYTNVQESFIDLNGNGVWDTGEPFRRYGDAPAPVAGRDPTLDNEPFVDLNGDGLLSQDDQALFERHADEVLRALLGSDVFGWYPDLFNVFRLRVVSAQAGHGLRDASGRMTVRRETALGGLVRHTDRGYFLGADSLLVRQVVQEALPEAHAHIVLLNQPVPMGRANAFVLLGGGPFQSHLNSVLVAHELGHRIAGLADEYVEYPDAYTGIEPSAVNVTTLTEPDWLPWSALLAPDATVPTAVGGAGVGLFEGAFYRPTGVYRPATACIMATGVRFCPVCTIAIQEALAEFTSWPLPAPAQYDPSGPVEDPPILIWSATAGASSYRVEIEALDGSAIVQRTARALELPWPEELPTAGAFRWRVQGCAASRCGDWSPWTDFEFAASTEP